jgi:protein-L-isoaspartate(D-aspartate) O-methyltransferase
MRLRASGNGMTSERTRTRMIERLREKGIRDEAVLAAMQAVPRHIFIEEALESRAYEDTALPIGHGQTISQPFVIARMLEELRRGRGGNGASGKTLGKTLEIGTGCGYQAAVIAHLASDVYSIERIEALAVLARRNLRELRLPNLRLKHGDGNDGIAEAAPFDTIISAAATAVVPPALLQQLGVGGKMILPVGSNEQALCLIERTPRGFRESWLDAVRFVPLLSGTV